MKTEFVGNCFICKKALFREDNNWEKLSWVYHKSIGVICKHHNGVESWYNEKITELQKELELIVSIPP